MAETRRPDGAIVTAFTGIMSCPFDLFQEYAERILERPIMTHEFAQHETWTELKAASKPDFVDLIGEWYPDELD